MQAKTIRDLQADARFSLLGHLWVAVGTVIFYSVSYMILASLNTSGLTKNLVLSTLLTILLNYLVSVFIGILEFGVASVFLGLQLGRSVRLRDIFLPVRENADLAVRIKGYICFLFLLASLPSLLLSAYLGGKEGPAYWVPVGAALLFGFLVRMIISICYGMIDFLFLDFPDSSPRELLGACRRMMRGHRIRLFFLHLSFLPLHLLGLLSVGIGNLWVTAYEDAALAAFYMDLVRLRKGPGKA